MADVNQAVLFVLKQEDAELKGEITNIESDRGGRTRFGISEKNHPSLVGTGFFDTMSSATALVKAILIYTQEYAMPMQLGLLVDQNVANALLSFAVNEGTGEATKILQLALNLVPDGIFGQQTINKVNSFTEGILLGVLYNHQLAFYQGIVKGDPSQAKFLKGWINRVRAACLMTVVN